MTAPVDLDELLAYPGRSTRVLVDLDVLRENASRLSSRPGAGELMAVVKADGYGHGAVMVAREAVTGGATWLAVATVAEGLELRSAGLQTPILILSPIDPSEIEGATAGRLDVTVGDLTLVDALVARAGDVGVSPRLHIKVDTGLHRYGLAPSDALAAFDRLESVMPGRTFAVSTHFAAADDPTAAATTRQLDIFRDVVDRVRRTRPDIVVHAANSSASVHGLAPIADLARIGIALYGCGFNRDQLTEFGLRPAMSMVSRLTRVHHLERGDGVSYGHTYVAAAAERVGLVPIGYADGYPRSLSNRGTMTVDGRASPVRGRVCMDQTVVGGLTPDVPARSWVGVAGPALAGPTWDDLARRAGTISYELLTLVGRRVVRLYHRSGRLVAVRDELGGYVDVDDDNNAPVTEGWPGRASRENEISRSR